MCPRPKKKKEPCKCCGCGGATVDPRSGLRCGGDLKRWARMVVARDVVAYKAPPPERPHYHESKYEDDPMEPMRRVDYVEPPLRAGMLSGDDGGADEIPVANATAKPTSSAETFLKNVRAPVQSTFERPTTTYHEPEPGKIRVRSVMLCGPPCCSGGYCGVCACCNPPEWVLDALYGPRGCTMAGTMAVTSAEEFLQWGEVAEGPVGSQRGRDERLRAVGGRQGVAQEHRRRHSHGSHCEPPRSDVTQ